MGPMFIIAQVFGVISIILGFVTFQMRTKRQMLFILSTTALVISIQYLLLGAYTGMALNAINILRNLAYDYRDRKEIKSPIIPIIFTLIQVIIGILTWQNWFSILALVGTSASTLCIGICNPQNLRKSVVITSVLILIYDLTSMAFGGAVYKLVSIISSSIGIVRHRKENIEIKEGME